MTRIVDPVELTRVLIGFNTVNPPGNEESCARHLGDLLASAGFDVAYAAAEAGRTSVVARRGDPETPALCLSGHLDTVPLGEAVWRTDPFGGEIVDGLLYGRGATDMKGGVAALVGAAMATEAVDTPLLIVLTAGEETGCDGARHLTRQSPALLGSAGGLIVAEPTGNAPWVGHKGALWLDAEARGVTAHGAMPERGDNAIYRAARAITALAESDAGQVSHPVLGNETVNVGTIAGGLNINSVPDRCRFGIDVRTVPGSAHEAVKARLAAAMDDDIVSLTERVDLPGVWTDPAHPWVRAVRDVVAAQPGLAASAPGGAHYFTDASELTPHFGAIPTVILGPGEPGLAHQTDEYCRVDRIEQAQAIYRALIERWAG